MKILVVDDDLFLSESLRRILASQSHDVETASNLGAARQVIIPQPPDLLILDLSLPDGDGVAFCREVRENSRCLILMLTSRGESIDKVVGLEAGADDYLVKPFDPHELLARVRALGRRASLPPPVTDESQPPLSLVVGPLTIHADQREAFVSGVALDLTQTEFDLLLHLACQPNRAIHRDQLFSSVWGYSADFSSNSLDVLIYRIRNKLRTLGADNIIQTVRGYGFRLAPNQI